VVETRACAKKGNLLTLSCQQAVDCVTGSKGCSGGNAGSVFKYLVDSKAETDSSYPYTGKDGTCKYDASKGKINTIDYTRVSGGFTPMMSAVNTGPISVAIYASS